MEIVYIIILFSLIILGALLFLAAQFVLKKTKGYVGLAQETKSLWIWRSFIIILILFSLLIFYLNRNYFLAIIPRFYLNLALLIYFVSLIELVIIVLLLPELVSMPKRIAIELIVLLLLYAFTLVVFKITTYFLALATVAAYLLLKRSTRPAVSIIFSLPV